MNTAHVSSFVLISILRGQPRTPPSGDNLGVLDKQVLILFHKDYFTGRPPQGLFKVAVRPPHKGDSAIGRILNNLTPTPSPRIRNFVWEGGGGGGGGGGGVQNFELFIYI